ncbi:MAG: Polysaccharide biosynthesis protein [Microgenomates bacterium OLB23]|nr:MAG: Polysaccharide biosynthesis protein [Microgenomates bacterium OLB23]
MRRVFKNTSVLFFGKFVVALCGFLSTMLLTRYLGAHAYSQYAYVLTLTGTFFILADFGLSIHLIRSIAANKTNAYQLQQVLTARLILSAVSLVLLLSYVNLVLTSAQLLLPLIIMSFFQIAQWLSLSYEAYLQGQQSFYKAVLPQILVALLSLITVYIGMLFSFELSGIFSVLLIAQLCGLFVYMVTTKVYFLGKISFAATLTLVKKVTPLAIGIILATLYFKVDGVLLGYFYPPTLRNDLGIYAVAYKLFELSIVFSGYFIQALFPHLSSLQNTSSLQRATKKYGLFIGCVALIISGLLYVCAPQLIYITAGGEFVASVRVLRILAVAFAPTLLAGFFMSVLLATKKMAYTYLQVLWH